MGLVAPNGNTVESSWQNTKNGVSGIAPIVSFDASGFSARIAGEIKNFDITQFIPAKEARKIYKIGTFYKDAEETLAENGFAPSRKSGQKGFTQYGKAA